MLNQFGELDDELLSKQRYCAWRAAELRKALREGRQPTPPPSKDPSPSPITTPGQSGSQELDAGSILGAGVVPGDGAPGRPSGSFSSSSSLTRSAVAHTPSFSGSASSLPQMPAPPPPPPPPSVASSASASASSMPSLPPPRFRPGSQVLVFLGPGSGTEPGTVGQVVAAAGPMGPLYKVREEGGGAVAREGASEGGEQ